MKKFPLVSLAIIIIGAGGYCAWQYGTNTGRYNSEHSAEKCAAFRNIEHTYCNDVFGFVLTYPQSYISKVNPYGTNWLQVYFGPQGASVFTLYAEPGANYCYHNLCDRAAKDHETYNGIVWDYLGRDGYCDGDNTGGGCDTSEIYRTKGNGGNFYISSISQESIKAALKTFRFI